MCIGNIFWHLIYNILGILFVINENENEENFYTALIIIMYLH